MPELPDISAYIKALEARILGATLEKVRLTSPFLLRTVDPPLESAEGRTVTAIRRIGKRIAIGLEGHPGQKTGLFGTPESRGALQSEVLQSGGEDAASTAGPEAALHWCGGGATGGSEAGATIWLVRFI